MLSCRDNIIVMTIVTIMMTMMTMVMALMITIRMAAIMLLLLRIMTTVIIMLLLIIRLLKMKMVIPMSFPSLEPPVTAVKPSSITRWFSAILSYLQKPEK